MIARLAALAAAANVLAGCALLEAPEQQDLYTVTPKSTFDPDLPSVYWQLAVEAPAAAANLNTGRIALALTPTSSDYYAKAAWTDRAPLMVQTRIVDSFENTKKIVAVARESIGIRSNYVLQPDLRNFEALYYYGKPPIVRVRIIAKLVRMPDRQIIGVASFERCVRARADKVAKVVQAFDQALGSEITLSIFTSQNSAIFSRRSSSIGSSARAMSTSGWIPIARSSRTECCVGFVLSSPVATRGRSERCA